MCASSASNLAVALAYLITVLTAPITGFHASVSFADFAPRKNLISPSFPGHLSYISLLCRTHLLQLNRKWRGDSGTAPHWHIGDSIALMRARNWFNLAHPVRSCTRILASLLLRLLYNILMCLSGSVISSSQMLLPIRGGINLLYRNCGVARAIVDNIKSH